MNFQIVGLVALIVFIIFGQILPENALREDKGTRAGETNLFPKHRPATTRLSRRGAIAVSVVSVGSLSALLGFLPSLGMFVAFAIVAIALWAASDSYKVGLQTYQTRIAIRPIAVFNAMILFWPIFLPWYLIVCSKIGDGSLSRKSDLT